MMIDGTGRYDSRDGVLVNHLAHGVFQQDNKLVKRLESDLAV